MDWLRDIIKSSLCNHKESRYLLNNQDNFKYIPYGTAGFRGKAAEVEHLFLRVGIITGMRCWIKRANVGVMITASHNPVEDNGVKIIDSMGEMLNSDWERIVEEFCNFKAQSIEEVVDKLISLVQLRSYNEITPAGEHTTDTFKGKVFIGCDTRPSSKILVDLVSKGLDAWNIIKYEFMGEMTTPALHFIVAEATLRPKETITSFDYYRKLLDGFVALYSESAIETTNQNYDSKQLVIDCANGVGAHTMQNLNEDSIFARYLPIQLINTSEQQDDVLNYECGADYVKTMHLPPRGASDLTKRYASLDGDADRVVYYYLKEDEGDRTKLILLDGDKILALYARYLTEILKKYHLEETLSLAAIQTAYANGASTDYLKHELQLSNVECVDTGVKNLHRRAINYDIAIYFEANGHGTIWISNGAKSLIKEKDIRELQMLMGILNNYTGDAISDILIVEMILKFYGWDVRQWDELYQDRPNSLIKVEVTDRGLVATTNAGRTCLQPVGLQAEIDKIVSRFDSCSRSFVRASGTENVVRIYAESLDQKSADELAQSVGEKTIEFCNR